MSVFVYAGNPSICRCLFIFVIVQVCFVINIVRTGRPTLWILLVIALPFAGSVAYFIVEILPEWRGTRAGRKATRKLQAIVNPDKELKQATWEYSISSSIENALRLANALLEKAQYAEAPDLFCQSLKGIPERDSVIMYGSAKAEFGLRNYAEVKQVMNDLISFNPEFKNPDAHLLYARNLEHLGDVPAALHEYATLNDYYPGPEASYHYAKLLQAQGDRHKARGLYENILHKAKVSGSHYHDIHGEWIKLAKEELKVP